VVICSVLGWLQLLQKQCLLLLLLLLCYSIMQPVSRLAAHSMMHTLLPKDHDSMMHHSLQPCLALQWPALIIFAEGIDAMYFLFGLCRSCLRVVSFLQWQQRSLSTFPSRQH
jgi:hypothetical protein